MDTAFHGALNPYRPTAGESRFSRPSASSRDGGDRDGGLFVEVEAPKPAWFEETDDGEYARALGEAAGVVEREPTS